MSESFDESIAKWAELLTRLKEGWPAGPWDSEVDRLEWIGPMGYPCLVIRSTTGGLCGYVGVSAEHPAYGRDYEDLDVRAHGGLTYASKSSGVVRYRDEEEELFWIGFDCAHAYDITPTMMTGGMAELMRSSDEWQYRHIAYVRAEVESLAEQLAEMNPPKELP